jgi:hypothetical protein
MLSPFAIALLFLGSCIVSNFYPALLNSSGLTGETPTLALSVRLGSPQARDTVARGKCRGASGEKMQPLTPLRFVRGSFWFR